VPFVKAIEMRTAEKQVRTEDKNSEPTKPVPEQNDTLKRIGMIAAVGLTAFMIGLIPMWLSYRSVQSELKAAQIEMRPLNLRNDLATAAIRAGRGEYEAARQLASNFFTSLRSESQLANGPYAGAGRREPVNRILEQRDETITLLARNDPAAAARLVDLYYELLPISDANTESE
jgi:hypothetical protein